MAGEGFDAVVAKFPSNALADDDVGQASNRVSTTLTESGGIDSSETGAKDFNSVTSDFPDVGVVTIGDERILYTAKDTTNDTLTLATRGFDGSTASSHSNGDSADIHVCAIHVNTALEETQAVENVLLGNTQADLTLQSTTADGSTKPLAIQDSGASEVWSVNSDGDVNVTGSMDLSSGSFVFPTETAPSPTTEGQAIWDTDDDVLRIGDGSTTQVFESFVQAEYLVVSLSDDLDNERALNDGANITFTDNGANGNLDVAFDGANVTLSGTLTYTNAGAGSDPTIVSNDAAQVLALTGTLEADGVDIVNAGAGANPSLSSNDASQLLTVTGDVNVTGALTEGGNAVPNSTDTLDFFSATTSSELASIISDETGSGALVFGTSPTLTTDVTLSQTTADYTVQWNDPASARTLTIPDPGGDDTFVFRDDTATLTSKTFDLTDNTLTGTGAEFNTAVSDETLAFHSDDLSVFSATTSAQLAGVISDETGSGALVFGTSPTLGGTVTFTNAGAGADPTLASNDAGQVLTLTGDLHASNLSLDGGTTTIDSTEINLLDGMTAKTGADASFVTGTAGSNNEVVTWNADGDAVSNANLTWDGSVLDLENSGASVTHVRLTNLNATDGDSTDVLYRFEDSGGNEFTGARLRAVLDDATDTTEDSTLRIGVQTAGTLGEAFRVNGSGISLDGGTTTIASSELNLLDGMSKTGLDSNFVTGTSGTSGNFVQWNSDGDAVDSGNSASDFPDITGSPSGDEITVWTDSDTIQSVGGFTYDGTTLTINATGSGASERLATFSMSGLNQADDDESFVSFELVNDSPTRTEFARLTWVATDVTDTTEDGQLQFDTIANGSLGEAMRLDANGISLDGGTTTIASSELNLLDGMTAKTGADATFATGTAGTDGNLAEWNTDGDLVDSGRSTESLIEEKTLTPGGATLPDSNFPELIKVSGSTGDFEWYELRYNDSTDEDAYWTFHSPNATDATIEIFWKAAATSGDVVWSIGHRSVTADDAWDASDTDTSVTDTVQGTSEDTGIASTTLTTPWGAGEQVQLRIGRDADIASDTMSGDAKIVGVRISYA